MPIERAVFHSSAWQVYWTAPGSTPPPPPPNGPPVASFTSTMSGTTVSFDGSASHGTGGVPITSYLWDFGDGKKSAASSSPTASHTYAAAGTFTVNLTVTAADTQTASASGTVKIVITNKPPVAAFFASVAGSTVAVDASASSDTDGQIASYAWDFGDGATATGVTASHAYSSGGTKNIALTVKDNLGSTGVASHSVVLSSVPVADFTVSVSGNTLKVDATPTTDVNPINSYSWNWGESTTVSTYSFDTANDKHIVTLHPVSGNVLQCVVKSPDTGNIYASQTGNGSNGTSTPYESMYLSRTDSTGALKDSMKLIDGGHGTSFALEFASSKTHVWMAWQGPAKTGGTTNDIVRFPYPVGGGQFTRASPPPGMTVPYPGGLNNGYKTDMQFDVLKNRVVLRSGGPVPNNTYRQAVLSDFLAGKLTILNTVVVPSGPPTLQGYFTYDTSLFIYWGAAYTQTAGGPATDPNDPPVLKEYRWADGKVVATYDPSWWGKPYASSHYEPESSTLYNPVGGPPSAWVGFITGTTGSYKQDLIQVPLLTSNQSVPVPLGSGKTASHTYANTGTYTVTLTVTDSVGQTDTQTKSVAISGTTNHPPVASFVSSATNLTANLNASGSSDSDGSIASYAWNFGDGTTGSGVTASHTYAAGGSYTVALTVTDNLGATASVSHAISVSSAPPPPSGNGDSGVNQTGVAGKQQTGALLYQNLSGSTVQAKVTAAGTTGISFPAGTFAIPKFSGSGVSGIGVNFPNGMKSLLGAGSASSILAMPTDTDGGTHSNNGPNTTTAVLLTQWENAPDGWIMDGINLRGTDQGSAANASVGGLWYHGLQMDNPGSGTMSNSTISGIPGHSGTPPSETFGLSIHQQPAGKTIMVKNCTFDGKRVADSVNVGAAICGTNTTRGVVTFQDCLFENTGYSAGLALWEIATGGTVNLIRPVFKNCRRNLGNEAQGGTINIYDPMFYLPTASGEDDIRITWTSNFNSGAINLHFTSQSNLNAMMSARGGKKLVSQTTTKQNYGGSAGGAYAGSNRIVNFFHIFVANVEVDKTLYWTYSGS